MHVTESDRTDMTDYPMNRSPRCGAHARTTGKPCMAPCLRGRRRCRLHGGWSTGAPRGEQHPNFKTGKYSREGQALRTMLREMRRTGEALVAKSLNVHGLRGKIPKQIRRRTHVKKALAKAKQEPK